MNYTLFHAINSLAGNSTLDTVMKAAARYLIFVVFLAAAILCLRSLFRRQLRPVALTGVALLLTFLLGLAEAALYSEKRPFQTHHVHQLIAHAPGQSFPSDHATAAFAAAFAVAVFLSRPWGGLLAVLALWIGFARVYDGIHYPVDIAGGILAAAVAVTLVFAVDRWFATRRRDYRDTRVRVPGAEPSPR
jgi:undecaprenyl-diphosphatase